MKEPGFGFFANPGLNHPPVHRFRQFLFASLATPLR